MNLKLFPVQNKSNQNFYFSTERWLDNRPEPEETHNPKRFEEPCLLLLLSSKARPQGVGHTPSHSHWTKRRWVQDESMNLFSQSCVRIDISKNENLKWYPEQKKKKVFFSVVLISNQQARINRDFYLIRQ